MKFPSNREPIAIIGMSGIFPKALTLEEFWRNIREGVDCIIEVPKERWDPELYYDPDFRAEDKTYCKIGGFITGFTFDGLKFRIPPAVSIRLDRSQQLALVAMERLFEQGGFERRDFDRERTGVILGNAQGGDNRDHLAYRVYLPQMKRDLLKVPRFRSLDPAIQEEILAGFSENIRAHFPKITEDSMPGGLSNVIAGRLANRWNLRGPNYTCDAACASGLAALSAAVDALREGKIDLAVTGAVDTCMAPSGFIQFSKIGALSPDLSCPFDHRANGFVMGEGAGLIILKRLSDAVRDGDEIFALIRGIGGSSDGKGKGITAPNPIGQELAIRRAFEDAGYGPESVQLVEAHGTSTKVGDVVEFESLMKIFSPHVSGHRKIGLGSVKSNIGHLKAAAGIAGLLKAVLALHEKLLPPSINFEKPNPALRIEESPFYVVTEATPWPRPGKNAPRRANVSAFGFGGTNFHIALEEYDPGLPPQGYSLKEDRASASPRREGQRTQEIPLAEPSPSLEAYFDTYLPLEGEAFFLGGKDADEVGRQLTFLQETLERGPLFGREAPAGIRMVELAHPLRTNARNQPFRVAFSAVDPKDLGKKVKLALEAIAEPRKRHMFRVKGIFFTEGERAPGKIAFMFPGQGSQYVNMCRNLYRKYRIVHDTLVQADEILYDLIGERILDLLFVDDLSDPERVLHHEAQLTRTEVMQPVILAADVALSRLLGAFGITPDVVMGHSLGEYAAAVVAEVMSFEDALYAVSVRGREMEPVLEEVKDPGKMASVGCSTEKAQEILEEVSGYVIVANKNCNFQTVIAGESGPMAEAIERFRAQGIDARLIPVSHAFHSAIVAPAGPAYRKMLERLDIRPPKLPILCNATADYYPTGPNAREEIIELLVRHFHSPVEFIPQVERMYADGVRYFIEVGPKKTLASFVDNLLRGRPYTATCTDHPRRGDIYQFNEVLALLSSRGFDVDWADKAPRAGSRFYLPPFLSPGASPPEEVAVAPEAEGVTRFPLPKGDDLARYAATQAALEGEAVVIGAPSSHRLDDTLARAFEEMPDTTEIVAQHPRHGPLRLVEAAHLLRNSAQAHPLRVGFAAATFADLRRKIDAAREALRAAPEKRAIFARKGIFVGAAEIEGKTAFLFPGQGSQYIGMCRDLAEKYRVVRETFAEADEILHPILDRRLTDLLFTDSAMGKEERKAAEEALRQTEITQPAMLTADVAILRLLAEHGIHPDIVAGHSLGEYAACVAAGVMSFPDALRAVAVRGSAMGSIKGVGDPGKMASISAPEEKVAPILAEIPGYLAIANKNSYGQTVIAGESAAVDAAVKRFMALRIPAVPLSVSNAFHTRLVASAATPVRDFLRKIPLSPPRIPVIANVTARPYPSGPDAPAQIVERLTEQIVSSVEFIRSVEAMYEAGARIFIEVGPKRALTGFVENILSGREFLALPTNHPKKGGVLQFSEALAALSVNHHPFDWKTATPAPGNTLYTEFFRTMKEPAPLREETTMKRPADDVPPLDQPRDASVPAAPPSPAEKAPSSTASPRPITVAGEGSKTRSLLDLFGCLVDDEILALLDDDAFLPYLEAQQEVIRSFLKASFRQHKAFFARLTAEMGVEARPVVPPPAPAGIEDHPFPPAAPPAAEPRREGGARISAPVVPSSAVSSVEEGRPASTVTPPVQRAHPERREAPAAPASPPPAAAAPAAPRSPMEAMRAPVGEIPPEWIGADFEKVKRAILPLVVEKTGYPEEMLELDLDMEADLGIDTVKQAELFGELREHFHIPFQEGLQIKDFPTLRHVIDFVVEKLSPQNVAQAKASPATGVPLSQGDGAARSPSIPQASAPSPATSGPSASDTAAPAAPRSPMEAMRAPVGEIPPEWIGADFEKVKGAILPLVVEKTGYPEEMLELDLDMEADLGIDTVKQAELFGELREHFHIPFQEGLQIKDFPTLRHVIDFVVEKLSPRNVAQAKASPATVAPLSQGEGAVEAPSLRPLPTSPRAADLPPSPPSASDAPRTEAPTGERPPTSRSPMEAMRAPVGEIPPEWIGADFEKVKNAILPMFVEKTGYPEEMLELDLDMEADLGIDTVKQAETFAEIRDHFQIPIDQSLQIKDYPTLRHVIEFVVDLLNRPQNARSSQTSSAEGAGEGETPSTPPPAAKASTAPEVRAKGEPSKMRRMIVEVVEKPLSPKKERHSLKGPILLVSDHGTPTPLDDHIVQHWPRDLSVPLVRIGHGSKSKQGRIPCDLSDFDAVARTISEIREKWGTIGGVIFLLGYGTKLNVERSQFTTWRRHLDMQVRGCFHVAKCVIPDLEETEGFFLSATNLDGFHGYGLDFIGDERKTEIENPLGAGLTGIVKTISKETHERGVRCKALDFAKMHRPLVARKIIQEILEGDSLIEVGYHARKRYGLKLTAAPLETEDPVITIDRDTTILVTGGAQGISAAICKDLAARFQPKLLLLGRTPLPEEVEHLARLDEAALQSLRMQIREELKAEGLRGTPVEVETRFTPIAKGIAIHENLEELRALGASVEYFTADAGDPQALGEVLDRIEKDHGKIDIVIHGAGVEMSKLIVDKPLEHLDQTFSGKLHGAFLLIKALRRLSTHTFVTFSSIVGRFGSYGQADYAAANEILTKLTFEAQRRLGIRGIVIDWTAWDEIGMVMRRSTRRVLLEMKVDLLSPDEGVSFLRNELLYNRDGGEVMIAGSVGPVDEDGLLDAVEVSAAVSRLEGVRKETPERFPFIDEIVACRPGRSITAKHFLDLERDRFMADHAFEGTPLLPGVMGLEAFAEAASLLTGSTLCFVGASQVAYRRPVKLLRNEGVEIFLRLRRLPPPRSATRISFHAELYSYFRNPKGEVVGGRRLNFEAVLHFASERPKNPKKRTLEIAGGIDPGIDREEIYRRFFHGPRFQVLDRVVATSEEAIVTEVRRIDPSDFFRDLPNPEFATAPMLLEALFQAAGVWEMYHHATASLPDSIWNLEIYRRIPARGKLFALARFRECEKDSRGFMRRFYDLEVIDERARAILSVQRYATISVGELPPGLRFKPVIREKVRLDDREVERLVSGHNGLDTVLSEGERRRLARFKNAERRRRWLAGQLAAKRAVQHFLSRMGGPSLSPRDIEIDQSARKSPSVTISAPGGEAVLSKGLSLSLSEETDHVVALLTPGNRQTERNEA